MVNILKLIGIGGAVLCGTGLYIGHLDGVLCGLLGISMVLVWGLGTWLYYLAYGVGAAIYKGAEVLGKASKRMIENQQKKVAGDENRVIKLAQRSERPIDAPQDR